jgi:hypothetical protein
MLKELPELAFYGKMFKFVLSGLGQRHHGAALVYG